jgi:cell division protein FtsB
MPFVTLVSLVLLGGVVGLLCFNTQMQQASFAATSLQTEADNLSAREQTLHDELQHLNDPQQLATRARNLGMVVGEGACTVRLADQTTDSSCAPASADDTPRLEANPPKKPAVLNPAPIVVTVPPPAGSTAGTGRARGHGHHAHRDTGRG